MDILFEVGNGENKVIITATNEGYVMESYMYTRTPQIIRTEYKNSEQFNNKTIWNLPLLLLHGSLEQDGIIVPVNSLN